MKNLSFLVLAFALTFNTVASASVPVFLDIVKSAGTVLKMTQSDAIRYCLDPNNVAQPAHLPSARELAQLSMSLGANGIVNACDRSDTICQKYDVVNADKTTGSFSFIYVGYQCPDVNLCAGIQRPPADMGNNWFWSSSVDLGIPGLGLILNGDYGNVAFSGRDVSLAVRCVSGR